MYRHTKRSAEESRDVVVYRLDARATLPFWPERRQRNAQTVIELMGFLNPHLKNVEDFRHKLWDHLFLISDFKLEVKSPYPIPTRESLRERPEPLPYPKRHPKHAHL